MKKTIVLLLFVALAAQAVLALEAQGSNESIEAKAFNKSAEAVDVGAALGSAAATMQEMQQGKLPVKKYNDTLMLAGQLYDAQLGLEEKGKATDYSIINAKLSELETLERDAYATLDELNALQKAIGQITEIDTAEVLALFGEAKKAFEGERYADSLELIDQTYEKISELEAFQTKVKALYDVTSRSFLKVMKSYWRWITGTVLFIGLAILLTHKKVRYLINKKRIERLEARRDSIKSLIAKAQDDYFNTGKLNENEFHIRTRKYGELIRDINRQIPTLREAMALQKRISTRVAEEEKKMEERTEPGEAKRVERRAGPLETKRKTLKRPKPKGRQR